MPRLPESFPYSGTERFGKNKDDLLDKISKKLDEFRGEWEVDEIHISFSEEEAAPFYYRADYEATLIPRKKNGKEV
jgi:hypothetical protein